MGELVWVIKRKSKASYGLSFNISNPIVNIGYIYGIFKEKEFRVKLNNRIYEQFIYEYFVSKLEVEYDKLN
ncbi:hypothetical protein [Clostridium grantii]|uniref:Uncharacterized protein n=1 Tax=Clostridium grantii DSM 8605 TaxID=1121316 RepID=A0A1M5XN48_9CLOT|nr:hypothetical protein [Clostridium grantii]SHI01082.1 hypothetical protein SAMN02745207_03792 [Clostridium grantii DSM 8605]